MADELLRPSLESAEPVSILSSGALMGAAFFGGPIAVTAVAVMNSHSLGRLKQEWPTIAGIFIGGAIALYLFATYAFEGIADTRSFRLGARAAGFVAFGGVWFLHRKELRALSTLDVEPRRPWAPVIAACLIAIAVHSWISLMLVGD